MASRDLNATPHIQVEEGEVEQRGGNNPHIDHMASRFRNSLQESIAEGGRAQTTIATEGCFPFRSFRRGLLVIVLATIAAYLPVTRAGFIWDDHDYVTGNDAVTDSEGLRRIWLEPGACPYYYPCTFC